MFHVTFSVLSSEVVTEEHKAIAAKHGAKSRILETGSTSFSFHTEKLSLEDMDEIVQTFGHASIWGRGREASMRFHGDCWKCPMSGDNWKMIPGFDNSSTDNAELCLL